MGPSQGKEDPNPAHLLPHNTYFEESNQSILDIYVVDSLEVGADHHIEKQESQKHEELLEGGIGHLEPEVLSVGLEEFCFAYHWHSAAIYENELPGENWYHEDDTQEHCVVGGENERSNDPAQADEASRRVVYVC